jgi:lipopolysaccharide transport protein LptA
MRRVFFLVWVGVSSLSAAELAVERSTESPKTVITSRSARVLGKGKSAEFTGNVVLTRGHDYMSADRLVTEDDNRLARAWGKVFFRRDGAEEPVRWEAWGERAVYDTVSSSGTLWGDTRPAHARRTPVGGSLSGGVVDMKAPEISFSRANRSTGTTEFSAGIVNGRGGVYLKSVEAGPVSRTTELWADRADFDGPADLFRLTGAFAPNGAFDSEEAGTGGPPAGLDQPFARQTQGREKRELRGDVIILHPSDKRLEVERAVRANLLFEAGRAPAVDGKGKKRKETKTGGSAR